MEQEDHLREKLEGGSACDWATNTPEFEHLCSKRHIEARQQLQEVCFVPRTEARNARPGDRRNLLLLHRNQPRAGNLALVFEQQLGGRLRMERSIRTAPARRGDHGWSDCSNNCTL